MKKQQFLNYLNETSEAKSWDFLAAYCRHRGYPDTSPDVFSKFLSRGELLVSSPLSSPNMKKLGNAIIQHYNSKLYDAQTWCIQHFNVVSVSMLLDNGQKLHIRWA